MPWHGYPLTALVAYFTLLNVASADDVMFKRNVEEILND